MKGTFLLHQVSWQLGVGFGADLDGISLQGPWPVGLGTFFLSRDQEAKTADLDERATEFKKATSRSARCTLVTLRLFFFDYHQLYPIASALLLGGHALKHLGVGC
jgi:hypothetical protein